MKYVMMKAGDRELPIIFPNELVHEDVMMHAMVLCKANGLGDAEAVSAGTIRIDRLICTGKSTTLGLSARPQDTDIIQHFDYLHGILPEGEDACGN